MKKNEYFTIPNLMGYFRILLIPVFLYLYYHAETTKEYVTAFAVLAISFLTDLFDGKIARKFNMVTDFGKILDPIADKLTQCAMAVAITFRFPTMVPFLVVFVCKELYMGIMGLYIMKKYGVVSGAQMFGKVCTAIMDVGIFFLLLLYDMPLQTANIIILVMVIMMFYAWIRYIMFHAELLKKYKNA